LFTTFSVALQDYPPQAQARLKRRPFVAEGRGCDVDKPFGHDQMRAFKAAPARPYNQPASTAGHQR
jgi:hypothetical protein